MLPQTESVVNAAAPDYARRWQGNGRLVSPKIQREDEMQQAPGGFKKPPRLTGCETPAGFLTGDVPPGEETGISSPELEPVAYCTTPSYRIKEWTYEGKPSKAWEFYFWVVEGDSKKRIRRSGFPSKRSAEIAAKALIDQVEKDATVPKKRTDAPKLSAFVERYLSEGTSHKRARSVELDRLDFRTVLRVIGDLPLDKIGADTLERFMASRVAEGIAASSVRREATTLTKLLNVAVRWKVIGENPLVGIRKPKAPEGEVVFLSPEDAAKLLDACDGLNENEEHNVKRECRYLRPMLAVALYAGLRKAEILNLRWRDVDLEGKRITVRNSETFTTKSGKNRRVDLHPALEVELAAWRAWFDSEIVRADARAVNESLTPQLRGKAAQRAATLRNAYPRPDGYLFPSFEKAVEGKVEPMDNVKRSFAKAVKLSGIDRRVTLHHLRHTHAVWAARAGVAPLKLKAALGHSSLRTTEIYLRVAEDEGQGIAALLPTLPTASGKAQAGSPSGK